MGYRGFKSRLPTKIIGATLLVLMAPTLTAMRIASEADQKYIGAMWLIATFVLMYIGANVYAIGRPNYVFDTELRKFVPVSDDQE